MGIITTVTSQSRCCQLKKKYHLKVSSEVLFRDLTEDYSPSHSLPDLGRSHNIQDFLLGGRVETRNSQWLGLNAFTPMAQVQSLLGELRSCKPYGAA